MPPTWGAPWPNPPPLMGAPGMRRGAECVQGRVSGCAMTARGWCPYAITSGSQPRALHALIATLEHMLYAALSLSWQACGRQDLDATTLVLLSVQACASLVPFIMASSATQALQKHSGRR